MSYSEEEAETCIIGRGSIVQYGTRYYELTSDVAAVCQGADVGVFLLPPFENDQYAQWFTLMNQERQDRRLARLERERNSPIGETETRIEGEAR